MECKLYRLYDGQTTTIELIDTLWNVNKDDTGGGSDRAERN